MLNKLRRKIRFLALRFTYIPKLYFLVLFALLFSSLIIRLSCGGTHLVYNVLAGRSIFPGPFIYTVFYALRVVLFSIVLYFSLYVQRTYCEGLIPLILTIASAVMLLLEYKMIFGGVSLILAMLFSIVAGAFTIAAVILLKVKNKWVSVSALSFALLQLILFIQLISLSISI